MIGDWLAHGAVFLLAVGVVFLPGLALGAVLRLRGLALFAIAPGLSVGLLSLFAILFARIGVTWGLAPAAVATVLVTIVVWVCLRGWRRRAASESDNRGSAGRRLLVAGLVVGGALIAGRLLAYIGLPWAVSQTNDALFHLNALRWVAETGSASSLTLTGVIGGTSFYPGAWHAVASLVAAPGGSIPIAVNMVSLVIGALIWPLGIAFLVKVLSGGDRVVAALAAALSGGLIAFPQLMFEWGVLYPYALSVALVPAAVGAAMMLRTTWARPGGTRARVGRAAPLVLVTALSLAAIALAQPSSLLMWGLLTGTWLTGVLILSLRAGSAAGEDARPHARRRRIIIIGLVFGWAVFGLVWVGLAYLAGNVSWQPYLTPLEATLSVVTNGWAGTPPALGMSALLVAGLVIAVRRAGLRWLVVSWLVLAVIYVVCISTHLPLIKRLLSGPWYGDSFRLGALAPLVVVPLAAIGLAAILAWFARSIGARESGTVVPAAAVGVIAAIGVVGLWLAPVVQMRVADGVDDESRYALSDKSFLTADAHALILRLDDLVPEDALIIGNPSTGVGFAYALSERDVFPRTWSPPETTAWKVLADDLHDAARDSEVCEALAVYGSPDHVLDFGPGANGTGRFRMPGLTGFEGRDGFELVAEEGSASLWRITACR